MCGEMGVASWSVASWTVARCTGPFIYSSIRAFLPILCCSLSISKQFHVNGSFHVKLFLLSAILQFCVISRVSIVGTRQYMLAVASNVKVNHLAPAKICMQTKPLKGIIYMLRKLCSLLFHLLMRNLENLTRSLLGIQVENVFANFLFLIGSRLSVIRLSADSCFFFNTIKK